MVETHLRNLTTVVKTATSLENCTVVNIGASVQRWEESDRGGEPEFWEHSAVLEWCVQNAVCAVYGETWGQKENHGGVGERGENVILGGSGEGMKLVTQWSAVPLG